MKRTITIILLSAVAICAPAANKKKATATPSASPLQTIPKEAVQNPDGTYSYTDKQGKRWVYTKTPFGLMKNPFTEASAPASMDATKVVDKGEVIGFEHPTPFGIMRWEKKRSELSDDERRLVEAQAAAHEDTAAGAQHAKPE